MLADAVVTRSGIFEYDAQALGLPLEGKVRINRTPASTAHPETLESLRTSPITLGHPLEDVTPANFSRLTKGFVYGAPQYDQDGLVRAPILLGDEDLIRDVRDGKRELSVGYSLRLAPSLNPALADYDTIGHIEANHIALVDKGRAGPEVRVLDVREQSAEEVNMTSDEITKAVQDGISKAVNDLPKRGKDAGDDSVVKEAIAAAIAPVMTEIKTIRDEATREEAKAKAQEARKALEDEVRRSERSRYATVAAALPLVAEDKRGALADADEKDILVAALDGVVADAKNQPIDYLRGALAATKPEAKVRDNAGLPIGVAPYTERTMDAGDKRQEAVRAFEEANAKIYQEAGGI